MRACDLFCGAGGLSTGLEHAGIDVTHAVDLDGPCVSTYALNHPDATAIHGDLYNPDVLGRLEAEGPFDLLVGGPPCQPWSMGGYREGSSDPRNGFPAFIAAVGQLKPTALLIENVLGMVKGLAEYYWSAVKNALAGLGYGLTEAVLDAADFGVPQHRQRVFLVGLAAGAGTFWRFIFPSPSHGPEGFHPYVTAGAIVKDEPLGTPPKARVVYVARPNLRPSPWAGHLYNGGGRPLNLDEPAPTLLASMGGNKTPWVDTRREHVAYWKHLQAGGTPRVGTVPGARRITVLEAQLLQSFPFSYRFTGSQTAQYRQVGNAVPPRLGYVIGTELMRQVKCAS